MDICSLIGRSLSYSLETEVLQLSYYYFDPGLLESVMTENLLASYVQCDQTGKKSDKLEVMVKLKNLLEL